MVFSNKPGLNALMAMALHLAGHIALQALGDDSQLTPSMCNCCSDYAMQSRMTAACHSLSCRLPRDSSLAWI